MGDMLASIAGAAIQVMLQNLISLCQEEIGLIRKFWEDLDTLSMSLGTTQAFLNDAEGTQVTREAVKRWLIHLEAASFDADNVLDELNYEVHRWRMETGNKLMKKVRGLFSTRKMGLKIRSINDKLTTINQGATALGLQRQVSARNESSRTLPAERETASNPDPFVVGRENDVLRIVEILTHNEQEVFTVLPIVGMGGLGKTALAKLIFHHKEIKAHFEKFIWVYVSEIFDETTLWKKVLELLTGPSDDFKTKDALLRKLGEELDGKKYLLVLDDVWGRLDDFVHTLRAITSVKGNGIIVTTRSEHIVSIVGTTHIQRLSGLTNEDCWCIIKKVCDIPSEFENIVRKIANKCQGLPLAAKAVGGLLSRKPKEEWYSIEKIEFSNLGDEGDTLRKILKLSFDNLSSQSLKKCFAFCAIFPKGYHIDKSMLIHLWMAEGFLQSDDMKTSGKEYIDFLLQSSLLQVGPLDDRNIGYYTMHELVHELACSVSLESGPARCIYLKHITDMPKWKARDVRSLIFEGEIFDNNMLSDFKYLRGLVLIGRGNTQLPKIEHLIHLRCLDTLDTSITCSPKLIGNLYLLQTFRAKVASNRLPKALKKLINLRHVYVEGTEEIRAETELGREVVASRYLKYLKLLRRQKSTGAMSPFPKLQTLYIRRMHSSLLLENLLVCITSLKELQFDQLEGLVCLPDELFDNNHLLKYLKISNCGNLRHLPPRFEGVSLSQVEIIDCLEVEGLPENPHYLHKFTLERCPNIKSVPYNPSRGGSAFLRELTITDCGGLTELPIELLESCSSSLKSVSLWGLSSLRNMGRVIDCLQKMSPLTSLSVDLKHLATDDLPREIVGSFRSLCDLEITCGMEMWQRLQDLLPRLNALRKLKLRDIEMEALPEWLGELPSLRELQLIGCRELRSLPSKEALEHLTTLTVVHCPLLNLGRDDNNSEWHKVSRIGVVNFR